jgi:hypothetical protein
MRIIFLFYIGLGITFKLPEYIPHTWVLGGGHQFYMY